jgi:hypothetical protein
MEGFVMRKSGNILLYLAILIPILMIVIVAVLSLYPSNYPHSKYNFLYAQYDDPNLRSCVYAIEKQLINKTAAVSTKSNTVDCKKINLYVYDVNADTKKAISMDDAKKLRLSNAYYSPDGYSINNYCNIAPIFSAFGDASDRGALTCMINKDRTYSKKLNMDEKNKFYDKEFIAWILE